MQRLLGNEKLNFKVLSDAVQKLGGVPPLMTSSDMSNTLPDEKVCSRPKCIAGYMNLSQLRDKRCYQPKESYSHFRVSSPD